MRENSGKQRITCCNGVLDKVIIIDELPVFSHGLALTLNAKECVVLHSQYNTTEHILNEIESENYHAVFIGYSGAHDQENIRAVTSALKRTRTPVFVMSEEKHYERIGPLIFRNCKILRRNEFPERIVQEVMRSSAVQFSAINNVHSEDAIHIPSVSLTDAEKRVLGEMLKGYSLTEIAQRFSKSVKTISAQKHTAIKRLGIKNTQELYLFLSSEKGQSLMS